MKFRVVANDYGIYGIFLADILIKVFPVFFKWPFCEDSYFHNSLYKRHKCWNGSVNKNKSTFHPQMFRFPPAFPSSSSPHLTRSAFIKKWETLQKGYNGIMVAIECFEVRAFHNGRISYTYLSGNCGNSCSPSVAFTDFRRFLCVNTFCTFGINLKGTDSGFYGWKIKMELKMLFLP